MNLIQSNKYRLTSAYNQNKELSSEVKLLGTLYHPLQRIFIFTLSLYRTFGDRKLP